MALCLTLAPRAQAQPSFEVVFDPKIESGPVDGRILLLLSTRGDDEPRFSRREPWRAPTLFFGIDVEALAPGNSVVFDETVLGYPLESLRDVPADDYYVQAVLNRYTDVSPKRRTCGQAPHGPMGRPEVGTARRETFTADRKRFVSTKHCAQRSASSSRRKSLRSSRRKIPNGFKHVKIKSDLVSAFWGTDMHVGAAVLPARRLRRAP